MTKQEFSKIAMAIRTYYPRERILPDDYAMSLWYDALKDLDYQSAYRAVRKWAETNQWSPSISDIRGLCATFTHGEFNSWEDEWHRVCKTIQSYGYMREQEALRSLPEITRKIVVRLGYKNLCGSENPAVDRANFRDIYNNMVNKQKENEKLSQPIRQALEKATESRNAVLTIREEELPDKTLKAEIDAEENVLSEHVQGKLDELRRRLRGEADE